MKTLAEIKHKTPQDYITCVTFHGHSCPGLVYGYLVAKEATRLLNLKRSSDEEVIAICENDSCAVDALQVILGTSAGKGNLVVRNYGKNAYTIMKRGTKQAYRFARKKDYTYTGKHQDEFDTLGEAFDSGKATQKEKIRYKKLKVENLLNKHFNDIFDTKKVDAILPPYAPLSSSAPCAICGEMTMSSKMISLENGSLACMPCMGKTLQHHDK